jgi:hypothetical protein
MNRPYKDRSTRELQGLIETFWDDFLGLSGVAYEVQFRGHLPAERKAEVIARLVELAVLAA